MWAFPNKSLAGLGLAIVLTGTACATASTEPMSRGEQGRLAGSIVLVDQVGNSLEIVDKGFRYEVEVAPGATIQSGRTPQTLANLKRGDRIVVVSRDEQKRATWIAVSGPPLKRPVEGAGD